VINKEVREVCCFSSFTYENKNWLSYNSFGGQHFSTLPDLKSAENFASFDTLLDIFLKYFLRSHLLFYNFDANVAKLAKLCLRFITGSHYQVGGLNSLKKSK